MGEIWIALGIAVAAAAVGVIVGLLIVRKLFEESSADSSVDSHTPEDSGEAEKTEKPKVPERPSKPAKMMKGHGLEVFATPRFLTVAFVFAVLPAVVIAAAFGNVFSILGGAVTLWMGIQLVRSKALVKIPSYHFGVLQRFKKRTGHIWLEGMHVQVPFVETVELISQELSTIPIKVSFTTEDKLRLDVTGSLQYRPDPKIADRNGLNIFVTISEETITKGMEDAVQAKIGALGGVYKGSEFITKRHALGDFIDASLRLSKLPHEDDGVLAEKILDFYKEHWREVKSALRYEKQQTDRYSVVELRYGIDIETFALADVAFSKETQESFEKQQRAEARLVAFATKLTMAKQVQTELSASAQVALNAADVSLDDEIEKKVISVEGEAGVLGGLLDVFGKKGGRP